MGTDFNNPFKPGAGHMPPYLAGREEETNEFKQLLGQHVILENMILTGLRGVGKTVLLDALKPIALESGWFWAGTDLSESTSITEETMALRLITDLSVITSSIVIKQEIKPPMGFVGANTTIRHSLNFSVLSNIYAKVPGLVVDKLKAVLEFVWSCIKDSKSAGIIFAYDEAQTLSDHADKEQYPISLLLDVFQSIQKKKKY